MTQSLSLGMLYHVAWSLCKLNLSFFYSTNQITWCSSLAAHTRCMYIFAISVRFCLNEERKLACKRCKKESCQVSYFFIISTVDINNCVFIFNFTCFMNTMNPSHAVFRVATPSCSWFVFPSLISDLSHAWPAMPTESNLSVFSFCLSIFKGQWNVSSRIRLDPRLFIFCMLVDFYVSIYAFSAYIDCEKIFIKIQAAGDKFNGT